MDRGPLPTQYFADQARRLDDLERQQFDALVERIGASTHLTFTTVTRSVRMYFAPHPNPVYVDALASLVMKRALEHLQALYDEGPIYVQMKIREITKAALSTETAARRTMDQSSQKG